MDQPPLHEQRSALANPEQPRVLGSRPFRAECCAAARGNEPGRHESLEERLPLEVGIEHVADAVRREDSSFEGHGLAVRKPHSPQDGHVPDPEPALLLLGGAPPPPFDHARGRDPALTAHLVGKGEDVAGGPVRARRRDERPSARNAVDEPILNETLHGGPGGHPRDAELLAQLRLRRQRRVRLQPGRPLSQRLLDLEVPWDELTHACACPTAPLIVRPPSTMSSWPVTYLAASEARKRTTSAISSALAIRPRAILSS